MTASEALATLSGVRFDYPASGTERGGLRAALLGRSMAARSMERPALSDIGLVIGPGDRLALVGLNGSGKSTLLRLLAGLYPPSSGSVRLSCEATTVFDLAPLHSDATGRENAALWLRSLGRPAKHGDLQDIEAFIDIGPAFDRPVRTFSTGMRARLAFALATVDAGELVLVDEIVSAGDFAFVERAKARMARIVASSGASVIASHSDDTLRELCTEGLLIEAGRLVARAPIEAVLARYRLGTPIPERSL